MIAQTNIWKGIFNLSLLVWVLINQTVDDRDGG